VRKERIAKTWPLQAAPERQDNDIRKFEAIGTAPQAIRAGVGEALAFHQAVGADRKAARLRYLTMRWANRLKDNPRVTLHNSLESGQIWGLACVEMLNATNSPKFVGPETRLGTAQFGKITQQAGLMHITQLMVRIKW
jgi:selenocysteine lyase/cysteine desulfurase